jgi:hypothetical protein
VSTKNTEQYDHEFSWNLMCASFRQFILLRTVMRQKTAPRCTPPKISQETLGTESCAFREEKRRNRKIKKRATPLKACKSAIRLESNFYLDTYANLGNLGTWFKLRLLFGMVRHGNSRPVVVLRKPVLTVTAILSKVVRHKMSPTIEGSGSPYCISAVKMSALSAFLRAPFTCLSSLVAV